MQSRAFTNEYAIGASTLDLSSSAAVSVQALNTVLSDLWGSAATCGPAIGLGLMLSHSEVMPRVAPGESDIFTSLDFGAHLEGPIDSLVMPRTYGTSKTLHHRTVQIPIPSIAHARISANEVDRGRVPSRLLAAMQPERSRPEVNSQVPESLFDELGL